jgi:hypothetical protein
MEQKKIIEQIVATFRHGNKKMEARFFITTHSPYVLNVINNMLKKGSLITRNKDKENEIIEKFDFPHLSKDELSASFIKDDGVIEDMLKDRDFINADKIADISYMINNDTIELDMLNNKYLFNKES